MDNKTSSRYFTYAIVGKRTSCGRCNNDMKKGDTKLKVFTGEFHDRAEYKNFCLNCAYEVLNEEAIAIAFLIAELGTKKREQLEKKETIIAPENKW
jgi:uncharacterized 2Fe-2S/4Fe-4S cluster protein (DUF4445 family)